ncbi:MAG TPA: DUF5686 and carboxypeptidase regulatory-like domain-containing protein [Bacteroidales bacterium]|nr:DUF5686 and carboxypeptidase regulatory-like domain-containing protein [Bacteroidales bacterium]
MKYYLLTFLFAFSFNCLSEAQILKGRITDEAGNPIEFATIYISELRQGTTANLKGDYELRLPQGNYKVTYQCLGFQFVNEIINISSSTVIKNVVLKRQYYEIPEVIVSASDEDPAYAIMRKVIGMAPYYLNNVQKYKAEVYLKGNLVLNKIPKIIQKRMAVSVSGGKEVHLKKGDSFFLESYNEIEFTAPDKYVQKVISIRNTFPAEGDNISPMEFIQASFYEPEIADIAISPLSPVAFAHYDFHYSGITRQGEYGITKIQVIPKRKSQQLFEGYIFIIQDLWCLQSVDLTNDNIAGKIRIQQQYVSIEEGIWMPVSHNFDIDLSIVGVQADITYSSSVKYTEVKPNLTLKKPQTITTNPATKYLKEPLPSNKTEEQINKILEKDDLTNRDMVKLSKLMEKKSDESRSDSARKSLEIVDNTITKVEKGAGKKDSAYWAAIRPIPLSDAEKRSITLSDSLKGNTGIQAMKQDSSSNDQGQIKKTPKKFVNTLSSIGFGHTWRDTTGLSFRFGGLLDVSNLTFNTVDGFVYGLDFRLGKDWKKTALSIGPELKWAFSRQELMWKINTSYNIKNKRSDQIYFNAGHTSSDFNTNAGINPFLNMGFSLLLRKNYMKLFDSEYYTLGFITNFSPGLALNLSGTYQNRTMLDNTTSFSIFKPKDIQYTANMPVNDYLLPGNNELYAIRDMKHGALNAILTWTPRQRYRVMGSRKIPMGSDWPTFSFSWQHGINEFEELENPVRNYDMLRLEVFRTVTTGAFSEFNWSIKTGGVINKNNLTFYDFHHVNTQPQPVLLKSYDDAFRLPSFYSLSAPELFAEAHLRYTTPYLFIKYLPFLSNTLMRENLSISYLGSRYHDHYTEIGYSISEIFLLGEIGVYVGFDNVKYKSAGVSLILKFD